MADTVKTTRSEEGCLSEGHRSHAIAYHSSLPRDSTGDQPLASLPLAGQSQRNDLLGPLAIPTVSTTSCTSSRAHAVPIRRWARPQNRPHPELETGGSATATSWQNHKLPLYCEIDGNVLHMSRITACMRMNKQPTSRRATGSVCTTSIS